jgi:hypothetical protein
MRDRALIRAETQENRAAAAKRNNLGRRFGSRHHPCGRKRIESVRNVLLAAALVLLAPSAHAQTRWATYTNVRFAFAVDYPRDIFTGYAEADNSAGAIFKTDAPWVEMRAWGSYNVEKKSPRATVAEYYAGRALDYSSVKRDSFVVSGSERGAIFYDRCNFTGDRVVCVNLVYPAAQKDKWDKIVARMSRSLRAVSRGRGQ